MTTGYFAELAERLREGGVPADQVSGTIDDLTVYINESGTTPEEEFGPAADFAAELTSAPAEASKSPGPDDETWDFHADSFNEVRKLNEFGGQGWEVLSYDRRAGFRCRRALDRPQRWEYRREIVPPHRREAAAVRLAEDGWELAATWTIRLYLKRPAAATIGPAAELDAPPEAPHRHVFWSRRLVPFLILILAVVDGAIIGISLLVTGGIPSSGPVRGFILGLPLGAVIGLAFFAVGIIRYKRKLEHPNKSTKIP